MLRDDCRTVHGERLVVLVVHLLKIAAISIDKARIVGPLKADCDVSKR